MSERLHKVVVTLEAVLLAGPVTYLGGLLGAMSLASLVSWPHEPYEQAQVFVYLLPLLPLIAGWVLIVRFLTKGRPGLGTAGTYLWWLSGLGAAITLAAILIFSNVDLRRINDHPTMWLWIAKYFRELAFGLPAVVPLLHLLLLRPKNGAYLASTTKRNG